MAGCLMVLGVDVKELGLGRVDLLVRRSEIGSYAAMCVLSSDQVFGMEHVKSVQRFLITKSILIIAVELRIISILNFNIYTRWLNVVFI